ncbi:LacI family DNA-binding transcriptional regulator [Halobacillus amylolyticus]|uniref:LacI family transcriptional regulator n=1 Tax=Halobacillus amylolyticus TaxID=2932259 RepID=A0ABY4HEY7_9BACI|nr:LacI family DNA-binding transcriptional regulator [Halobacillus amylolyticus]UOR13189.1 LacI family transcriptional regulator [Halobacillus amylolyticus]
MATIEDVAKLAGLSRTTVSRVINDQPYVTEEKKKRIIHAMKDLGYVPNSSARRLRSQRTETIAVLLPRVTNPFFGHLIESLEKEASKSGYQVIVCQTHDKKQKEIDYLQLLKTKQVDGIVMASLTNDWEDVEPYLTSGPIVLCNEYMPINGVSMIHIDHRQAAYESTVHLIHQGCKHLAYASGGHKTYLASERKAGFLVALAEYDLPFEMGMEIDWALDVSDGQKVFQFLKENHPHVDGIFTGSDEVAAGIIYAASQSNWTIPNDLAVIGFDNQMLSLLMVPAVTTVEQPIEEMAAKTVEVLVRKMSDKRSCQNSCFIYPYQLIIRDSTKRHSVSSSAQL